jgi:hypothetical protein
MLLAMIKIVTPGLDPGVHLLRKRWMAGSSPAMTVER